MSSRSEPGRLSEMTIHTSRGAGATPSLSWIDRSARIRPPVRIWTRRGIYANACGIPSIIQSRFASYMMRALSPNLAFEINTLNSLPWPIQNVGLWHEDVCVSWKRHLTGQDILDRDFSCCASSLDFRVSTALLVAEGYIERKVFEAYELSEEEILEVINATGNPAAWHPLIAGYETIPKLPASSTSRTGQRVEQARQRKGKGTNVEELAVLQERLRCLFESGAGVNDNEEATSEPFEASEDDEGDATLDESLPLPDETFIEHLSTELRIHPVSVYMLLEEGIQKQGWRCCLRNDGFCPTGSPSQPCDFWVTSGPSRSKPANRSPTGPIQMESFQSRRWPRKRRCSSVCSTAQGRGDRRQRFWRGDGQAARRLAGHGVLQASHEKVQEAANRLATAEWQVPARTPPAFACLLYYHKLDVDALPKLRSQYVGPLRQRLETELRGITAIAAEARSDRQVKRQAELDDSILELQKFDTILEAVGITGFGPASLNASLRQYAIDDAMLALKARWLRRLAEVIAESPLPDWLDEADHTDLHHDLRSWIADAMGHLDYSCARVGPKPPDQGTLTSDPTAADLAKLISPQARSMLKEALVLACDSWWKQFEAVVLGPDKDQVKALKEEQRDCEAQLGAEPSLSGAEARHLRSRVKEIKEAVKALTARIKKRTARANGSHPDRTLGKQGASGLGRLAGRTTALRPDLQPRWAPGDPDNDRRVHRPGIALCPRHQRRHAREYRPVAKSGPPGRRRPGRERRQQNHCRPRRVARRRAPLGPGR